ncbi:DUF5999 family protein [Streptomyces lavendulae]|uniref:DUF5999 family protein n=1 Tax=Streptomyces lavendulae TaxID=1914 RepID=UPI0036765FFB
MTTVALSALSGCASSSDTLSWILQALKLPVESLALDAICEDINQVAAGVADEHESYPLTDRMRSHLEQGWALRSNGVIVFEDGGELLPDGTAGGPFTKAGLVAR